MLRRHDNLFRMFLTILSALLFAALLEAEGLHVWAERLAVGPFRETVLPITNAWESGLRPLGVSQFRESALRAKASLASVMMAKPVAMSARFDSAILKELPVSVDLTFQRSYEPAPLLVSSLNANEQAEKIEPLITNAPLLPSTSVVQTGAFAAGLQVVLAGDSMMAVGLAPTLMRGLAAEKGVRLLRAYRSGTGLARPEVFDWLAQYPQMLGDAQPQLVICALGANDGQNVQVGKKVLEFGSPEWDEFYRGRLTAYLEMLLKPQTRVLWLGMPVMRERHFAQKMLHMNALVHAELQRYPAVTWMDPNPALGYADSVFSQYRANERGKLIKMRADDGIHMTDEGAAYLLTPIRDWLINTSALAKPAVSPQALQVLGAQVLEPVEIVSDKTL